MATANANVKKVLESLKSKGTIVEEWHEGTDWYRIWSNGFMEQVVHVPSKTWYNGSGSAATVSLRKAYGNNSYTALLQPGTGMGENEVEFWVKDKSTSSMSVGMTAYDRKSQTCGLMVYTCGY